MSEQNDKNKKFSLHDVFLAVFYLIIVAIGINLCLSRGADANTSHLITVTISIWSVLGIKLHKYRGELAAHKGDVAFVALLCILSLFAIITTVIF